MLSCLIGACVRPAIDPRHQFLIIIFIVTSFAPLRYLHHLYLLFTIISTSSHHSNRGSLDRGFGRCIVVKKFNTTIKRYNNGSSDKSTGPGMLLCSASAVPMQCLCGAYAVPLLCPQLSIITALLFLLVLHRHLLHPICYLIDDSHATLSSLAGPAPNTSIHSSLIFILTLLNDYN
jgi:hypothetical protein